MARGPTVPLLFVAVLEILSRKLKEAMMNHELEVFKMGGNGC